jgi:hypothetical protein
MSVSVRLVRIDNESEIFNSLSRFDEQEIIVDRGVLDQRPGLLAWLRTRAPDLDLATPAMIRYELGAAILPS